MAPSLSLSLFLALSPLDEPPPASDSRERETERRIQFLQASLDRAQAPARLWYYGWVATFSAGLALRTTLAFTAQTPGARLDSQVGMVTLAGGLAVTLALAPRTLSAAGKLRALSGTTPETLEHKLRSAEALLEEAAHFERVGKSWLTHSIAIAISVGAGLYLGVGAERWGSAALATAGGVVVSELKIFTQPMTANRELAAYRCFREGSTSTERTPESRPLPSMRWNLVAMPLGLGLTAEF